MAVQTYQGYFQANGRFVADNQEIKIPVMRRTIINILADVASDKEIAPKHKTKSQQQLEAFERFVAKKQRDCR